MNSSEDKWFVEQFHLRSPVEEFQEFAAAEFDRLIGEDPKFDEATHRRAVGLVLSKLRTAAAGGRSV